MRGVGCSDLHLGFRQFPATIDGRNAREVDVERAWDAAVTKIIEAQPDLVTVAGDVFHNLRPSFYAVRAWQTGVRRIIKETPAEVVVILGNHESPRTAESLSPVVVVEGEPRVHVVTEPKRLVIRSPISQERVAIACLPFVALRGERMYRLEPDPSADVNVLLLHAAVRTTAVDGALPRFYAGETELDVGREAEAWDVIAVGDFHNFTRLHPERLAFYSGAIERTTSNIWDEQGPKGVIGYSTTTGMMGLFEVATRDVLSLELDTPNAQVLNFSLQALAAKLSRPTDPVVRVVATGLPRAERDGIDREIVRELQSLCLHFQLDLRYAQQGPTSDTERPGRGRSLLSAAGEYFAGDPEPVRACALQYLDPAEAA